MESLLVIRADANARIGTGHIMRCLALAQAWQDEGGKVVFISSCESKDLCGRINAEGFDIVLLDNAYPDPSDIIFTINTVNRFITHHPASNTWIVVDGYHFDSNYQKSIKAAGYRLLCLDDYGHADHYCADIVLNQNVYADKLFYTHREPNTQLLLGTRYVLLRREFKKWKGWQRRIPGIARKILVTVGGGDQDNVTLKIIQALKQIDVLGLEANIIVGPTNPHLEALRTSVRFDYNLKLLTNISDMSELMAWADLAVAAGGSTSWELAFMGLPSLVMVVADNQSNVVKGLRDHRLAIDIGCNKDIRSEDITKSLNELINNHMKRREISEIGRRCVDGSGSARVVNALYREEIMLREATVEDCTQIWEWANDPAVRASSFLSEYIPIEEHKHWFYRKIDNSKCFLFVGLNSTNTPIGQVRFDLNNDNEADVDVSVSRKYRGKGYGTELIRKGVQVLFQKTTVRAIHAFIKQENDASIQAFSKAGFVQYGVKNVMGNNSIRFTRNRNE